MYLSSLLMLDNVLISRPSLSAPFLWLAEADEASEHHQVAGRKDPLEVVINRRT